MTENAVVGIGNIDASSPYFLHMNENPGSVFISILLSGKNYHTWSRSMTIALRSKNKLRFIDGTLPRPPPNDPIFVAWDRCNTFVLSWVIHSLEPSILQSMLWIDTASDMWNNLRKRFYQGDVFRISDLQEEIYMPKQGDASVSDSYTHLVGLWQELENFRPIPSCPGPVPCQCQLHTAMKTYRDNGYVIMFLKGLNEQLAVRSQIMLMQPLSEIDQAFSMLIQQERQMNIEFNEPRILAIRDTADVGRGRGSRGRGRGSTQGGRSYGGRGKSTKVCTYCNKSGHMIDTCCKKHGFLPHYNKGNTVNNYIVDEEVLDDDDDDSNSIAQENENENPNMLAFTPEQHNGLLTLL